ncbi:MAG: Fic family protein [Janthinobacterium lividum]
MEKKTPWPLLVFATSDKAVSRRVQQARRAGQLRDLLPRVYTTDLVTPPATLVRRHWLPILGHLYPGAVISHRSGLDAQPTPEGDIFLTYKYAKKVALPGLTVHLLPGPGPQELDRPFGATALYFASETRALLENFQLGRTRGGISKTLPPAAVEEYLERLLRVRGEEGLNELRDQARGLAISLGWEPELARLQQVIAALLATAPSRLLTSPVARARVLGLPYDPDRAALFSTLLTALRQAPLPNRPDPAPQPPAYYELAFFEAYFSNFIEGTVFEVDEAHAMVVGNAPVPGRHADSHDVLSTYHLVSNPAEMRVVPATAEELLALLQRRHATLLRERPDKRPGQWKERANQAGNTNFVEPELVRGTLHQGFACYQALEHPLARAAMLLFVVSEVHPFDDGNGRLARIMGNAELVRGGLSRLLITTSYRQDYLRALRRLSRQRDPGLYLRMLDRAQAFTAELRPDSYSSLKAQLTTLQAFEEANEELVW